MEFDTNTLMAAGIVVVFWFLMDRFLSYQLHLLRKNKVDDARKLLETHGYSAHLYLPTIGQKDSVMAEAMITMSDAGYLIFDKNGVLAGKAVPNLKKEKHSSLKLIVDNSKKGE